MLIKYREKYLGQYNSKDEMFLLSQNVPALQSKLDTKVNDIVRNLTYILNTRQGSVQHLPDFGMPDLVNFYNNMPESLGALINILSNIIVKYEPRIKIHGINIVELNFDCIICLEINGIVNLIQEIKLKTKFYSEGRVFLANFDI